MPKSPPSTPLPRHRAAAGLRSRLRPAPFAARAALREPPGGPASLTRPHGAQKDQGSSEATFGRGDLSVCNRMILYDLAARRRRREPIARPVHIKQESTGLRIQSLYFWGIEIHAYRTKIRSSQSPVNPDP